MNNDIEKDTSLQVLDDRTVPPSETNQTEIPKENIFLSSKNGPSNELERVLHDFNRVNAVIAIATGVLYIIEQKEGAPFLYSKSAFCDLYQPRKVNLIDVNSGKSKNVPLARLWLDWPQRRTFKGLCFRPDKGKYEDGSFNLWNGFKVKPKRGNCELFLDFVKKIICGNNEKFYEYTINWIAHMLQKPQEAEVRTAIVLKGPQGIGKGVFANTLGSLLGDHYATVNSLERICGRFNSVMQNKLLVLADEAISTSGKAIAGPLKALITERNHLIEPKGKEPYTVENLCRLIIASNNDNPVPLDADDRRFFFLDVCVDRKEDTEYFSRLKAEMDNSGLEALLYFLLNRDIQGFYPSQIPYTSSAFHTKLECAEIVHRYLYEVLKDGSFSVGDRDSSRQLDETEVTFAKNHVFDDFKRWSGLPDFSSSKFWRLAGKILLIHTTRPQTIWSASFQPLSICRKSFEKFFKSGVEIWDS